MGFGTAIKTCFGKYADFSGRARRSEFWWWYLFTVLVTIPLVIVFYVLVFAAFVPVWSQAGPDGTVPDDAIEDVNWVLIVIGGVVMFAAWLALAIPTYAVWARRLHDMGQSGHWLWLNLVSLGIVPLIMAFLDSERGANRWGADPKEAERPQVPGYPAPGYPASGYPAPGAYGGAPGSAAPGYAAPGYPAPASPAPPASAAPPAPQAPAAPASDAPQVDPDNPWATPQQPPKPDSRA
ncbi:DUF805 domain-containing protein [Demequina sp. NBRC 110053]|uniref:DUF805 domain-containing protein n=1 Tax=Demequina sp. NBRC 110053 TaxID=1570342 RepID=UPI001F46FAD6|nr:DUF805 domain-containing protein [Demequina sp. NBRC 110053]